MTSRDFAYWLQGFFEISNPNEITPEQIGVIKKHLNLVFKHEIDPSMGDEKHQVILNEIHQGGSATCGISENPNINNGGKWNRPDDLILRC